VQILVLAFGIALGALLTLVTGLLQDRLRRRWDRDVERERRAEAAGHAILPLLDEVRDALSSAQQFHDEADEDTAARAADKIEQLLVQIPNAPVKQRLRDIATSVRGTHAIAQWCGDTPSQVGWHARRSGQNAIGALMATETLEARSIIDTYAAAIREDDAIFAEMAERQVADRRCERATRRTSAADS
jgi:hypothetical protein